MWVPIGKTKYACSECKHRHINTINSGLPEYCPICGNDQYPIKPPKPIIKNKQKEDDSSE